MGVYVPGMKIPKNCHECVVPYPVCFRKNRPQWEVGPHQNCPLVEVPTPHGRLIDADALDRAAQKEWDDNEITSGEWVRARERIRNVPTVIEREV